MRAILFDVSLWVPIVLALVGLVLLIGGNKTQGARSRNTGLVILSLAILWLILTFVVETPRKACENLARRAVQAATDGDWNGFDQLLESNVDARYVGRNCLSYGRQQVDETARMIVKNSVFPAAFIHNMRSTEHDSLLTVAFTASIDSELTPGHPIPVDWEFDFRQSGGQWRIGEIRVLKVDDTEPEGIRQSLNKSR
jgi:hypothetical protein